MKKLLSLTILSAVVAMQGCATIIQGSDQTLSFKSVPELAKITVTNRAGEKIYTGQTPTTVTLKKGAGYFKPENYQVSFSKDGYQTKTVNVTGSVNGWYVANIIFGGLIGLLIVDPMTGAMYKLSPEDVNTVLESNNVKPEKDEKTLTIVLKENVPSHIFTRATLFK